MRKYICVYKLAPQKCCRDSRNVPAPNLISLSIKCTWEQPKEDLNSTANRVTAPSSNCSQQ